MGFACLAHGLAEDARRQLDVLTPHGLQAVAFAPNGGWVVVARAAFAARGIPDACFVRLRGFVAAGQTIRSIAFPPAGPSDGVERWVIVTDREYHAGGIPDDCFAALAQGWAHGLRPSCIAFPQAVGSGVDPDRRRGAADAPVPWVMLTGRTVLGRGIDDGCWQRLNNLAQGLRPARQVAFAPGGGWATLADDRVTVHGLPDACRAHVGQLGQAHVVEQLGFASNGGWLVGSGTPAATLPADPLRDFEERFRRVAGRWRSLAERMAVQHVAGLSVAVALDGRLAWATRYGSDCRHDRIDAERGQSMRDALLAQSVGDVDNDFADTCCRLRRYPADRASCAVLADGGGAAGRAALAEEVVDALVRIQGWHRSPTRQG